MVSALFYLQFHSLVNRTLWRIRRLKQPKYLFGAIVGLIYFYFYFGRFLFGFGMRRGGAGLPAMSADTFAIIEPCVAMALLGLVLLAWLLPRDRAALIFTEAEIAFLFPAPVSRRGLIHYRLLRGQLGSFLVCLIIPALTRRWGGHFWFHALGWWTVLSALSLHGLGSSFARTQLMDRGITTRTRRLVVLGLAGLATAAVYLWAKHTLPAPVRAEIQDGEGIKRFLEQVFNSGPLPYLLFPFRLMVRPFFAGDLASFLLAFGPALIILALLYVWVIRSNVAFEEASVEASQKMAVKIAAMRSGNWQSATKKLKPKRPPFTLRPTGPPAVALLWKNLISAGNMFTTRLFITLFILIGVVCFSLARTAAGGMPEFIGMLDAILLGWSLMIGPQILRQDFRQDLLIADVLKTYPVPPWQIALGELLGPVVILTSFDWLLLLIAGVLLGQGPRAQGFHGLAASITVGAAMVIPSLNLIVFQIPNAAALLFPAWFLAGKNGPAGGIEAMGQRIIFFLGQLLAFALTLLPAGIAFAVIYFVGVKTIFSPAAIIPVASLGATLVLAAEAAVGIFLLGRAFRRFDVAEETSP